MARSSCGRCYGSGLRTCYGCGGQGKRYVGNTTLHPDGYARCQTCGGTGKQTCGSCGGSGRRGY